MIYPDSELMLTNLASGHDALFALGVTKLIRTNASFTRCFPLLASGVLKGFDPLLNLVLDGTIEYMRGKSSGYKRSAANVACNNQNEKKGGQTGPILAHGWVDCDERPLH